MSTSWMKRPANSSNLVLPSNSTFMNKLVLALTISLLSLTGCGESASARYDAGYSDGYAEGYNTTLRIRSTLVRGDWSDKEYSRGYNDGRANGVSDALQKK
ncbi:MAG: hypothetical protein RI978_542 [Verrucomicrobiota bacterium]